MSRSRTPRSVVKTRRYDHPPEDVWAALTDPRALAEWLMPNTFRPEVGAAFRFQTDPHWSCGGNGATDAIVLELDPPRKMVWEWRESEFKGRPAGPPTTVTWTLAPDGGGTILRLEHAGLESFGLMKRMMFNFGWSGMLSGSLARVLRNTRGGRFTPGAIPLNKRYYKATTVPPEFVL